MHYRIPTLATTVLVALAGCSPSDGSSDSSELGDEARGSYALGYDVGESMRPAQSAIDRDAFARGFADGLANASALAWEVRAAELELMMDRMRTAASAADEAAAEEALREGQAFLEENGARPEVTTTASGLQYEVLVEGDGPLPEMGDAVRLHYLGTLPDGTEFDGSTNGDPVVFTVGGLIEGFNEAMQLIPMGGKFKVYIPGDLAYGPQRRSELIGPNQVLVFEIEHFEIVE